MKALIFWAMLACSVIAQTPTSSKAQAEALKKFPELAVKDSPLNRAFLAEVAKKKISDPTFFSTPDWAVRLARQVQEQLSAKVEKPIAAIEASVIMREYAANEVAADANYKGKRVVISGVIGRIGKDILGNAFIVLGESDSFGVQCSFSDAHLAEVMAMSIGQKVVVSGEGGGKFGNVLFSNSVEVKSTRQ